MDPTTKPLEFRQLNPFSPDLPREREELRAKALVVADEIASDSVKWGIPADELREMAMNRFIGGRHSFLAKLKTLNIPHDHPIRLKLHRLTDLTIANSLRSEKTIAQFLKSFEEDRRIQPLDGVKPIMFSDGWPFPGDHIFIGNEKHRWVLSAANGRGGHFEGWLYEAFGAPTFWLRQRDMKEESYRHLIYGSREAARLRAELETTLSNS